MTRPDLNRKLILEGPTRTPDGSGGYVETWAPLGTIWGEIDAGGGGGESDMKSRLNLRIMTRAAPQGAPSRPQAGMRFRDGIRLYHIANVTESDARGRYLICTATEEVGT
jgi:head-tail adaptor